jgi:ATP diphosphatase
MQGKMNSSHHQPYHEAQYSLDDLLYLMQRLRNPDTGCPWDLKQTFKTILPYTLEEVYEVVDAIGREDDTHR